MNRLNNVSAFDVQQSMGEATVTDPGQVAEQLNVLVDAINELQVQVENIADSLDSTADSLSSDIL
ncbi:MAG: hypothetical protein GF381_00465 [Candidatus Pacebacteria bacterium]|nr:hypothetical protein [Candidatus Paceibacterota bacterium]